MDYPGIPAARISCLNERPARLGDYVLYWMQQAQRAEDNHALEFGLYQAGRLGLPLVVGFGLDRSYPEANARHFRFLLEGLADVEQALSSRGIPLAVRLGTPPAIALELAEEAALIVCDRGYLRHQKQWRDEVARRASCPVIQVESDAVVPVREVSDKAEFAARTIRPKVLRKLPAFLSPLPDAPTTRPAGDISVGGLRLSDPEGALRRLEIRSDPSPASRFFKGGTREGKRRLREFLAHKLGIYRQDRNQPQNDSVSGISPYLHFGQLSPLWVALEARKRLGDYPGGVEVFLEELIVRRELAINFVEFTPDYDQFSSLPPWARETLRRHAGDPRPRIFDPEELATARTDDEYWNAAMTEMRVSGFMHNYMRMYWGKKILEWSPDPETAFQTALFLNNRYFLDGRDPNSYAGIGWVFGLHDRPWGERPVYGMVRCMTASGLERKCRIRDYVRRVSQMAAES